MADEVQTKRWRDAWCSYPQKFLQMVLTSHAVSARGTYCPHRFPEIAFIIDFIIDANIRIWLAPCRDETVMRCVALTIHSSFCRWHLLPTRVLARGTYYPPQCPETVLNMDGNIMIWYLLATFCSSRRRARKCVNGTYLVLTD